MAEVYISGGKGKVYKFNWQILYFVLKVVNEDIQINQEGSTHFRKKLIIYLSQSVTQLALHIILC